MIGVAVRQVLNDLQASLRPLALEVGTSKLSPLSHPTLVDQDISTDPSDRALSISPEQFLRVNALRKQGLSYQLLILGCAQRP